MIRVGDKLKEERLRKGLSLQQVSDSTKIRVNFLEYIERGEYEKLPSVTFAQGFVKNYISFLGLPQNETLALFKREFDEEKIFRVLPRGMAGGMDFPVSRVKISQFLIIGLLLLSVLAFLVFQYKEAIFPPSVDIISPKENQTLNSSSVQILGKTDPNNIVFVNNLPVSVNDDGSFHKTLFLFQGGNDITIKVVNRFDKTTQLSRHVEVK